jgi:hypothetical protein
VRVSLCVITLCVLLTRYVSADSAITAYPTNGESLGSVEKGKPFAADIKIANDLGTTITVSEIKTSCNCTNVAYKKTSIENGAVFAFTINVDTTNKPVGEQNLGIYVTYLQASGAKSTLSLNYKLAVTAGDTGMAVNTSMVCFAFDSPAERYLVVRMAEDVFLTSVYVNDNRFCVDKVYQMGNGKYLIVVRVRQEALNKKDTCHSTMILESSAQKTLMVDMALADFDAPFR